MKRALFSLFDKNNIEAFMPLFATKEWEGISTGGTLTALQNLGAPCTSVESITEYPSILGGRVKTLHPKIFGGILARRNDVEDMKTMARYEILPFDMVVCNFYDFPENRDIEKIDVGGLSLLRAAVKNGKPAVLDPQDYSWVVDELIQHGQLSLKSRSILALKVFQATAAYDTAIATWIAEEAKKGADFFVSKLEAVH